MALRMFRVQPRRILAVTGVGRQASATRATISPTRSGQRSRYEPLFAFSVTCFTGQPKLMSTTLTRKSHASRAADLGERRRVVVPDLHGQRPRLVAHAPEPVGVFMQPGVELQEAAGIDHLGGRQAHAAQLPHDLPEAVVRVAGHRRLQERRVNNDVSNAERRDCRWR